MGADLSVLLVKVVSESLLVRGVSEASAQELALQIWVCNASGVLARRLLANWVWYVAELGGRDVLDFCTVGLGESENS